MSSLAPDKPSYLLPSDASIPKAKPAPKAAEQTESKRSQESLANRTRSQSTSKSVARDFTNRLQQLDQKQQQLDQKQQPKNPAQQITTPGAGLTGTRPKATQPKFSSLTAKPKVAAPKNVGPMSRPKGRSTNS